MAIHYRIVDIVRRGVPEVFKPEHEQLFCKEDEVIIGLLRGPLDSEDKTRNNDWVIARDVTDPTEYETLKQEYAQDMWSKVILYRVPKLIAQTTFQTTEPGIGGTLRPAADSQLDKLVKKSMLSKKFPE